MNRYTINSSNLNTEQQSVVQRAIIAMLAVASGVARYRLHFHAHITSSAHASAVQITRVLARSIVAGSAAAHSVLANQNRYWARLGFVASSAIEAAGTVYVRRYIQAATALATSALIWAKSITIGRGIVNQTALARMMLTGKNYYTQFHGVVNGAATVAAVIDFETRKQIPYDEDAPDMRAMLVPSETRQMMVN